MRFAPISCRINSQKVHPASDLTSIAVHTVGDPGLLSDIGGGYIESTHTTAQPYQGVLVDPILVELIDA